MTSASPQPAGRSSNKLAFGIIITLLLVIVCVLVVACLGPLGLFAWISDRQMDWFEEQTGDMAELPMRVGMTVIQLHALLGS